MNNLRSFKNIAKVVKDARTLSNLSQSELSRSLGFKNGQFISNVEREKCSVPLKSLNRIAKVTRIDVDIFAKAVSEDFRTTVKNYAKAVK